ncbi:hypothetical protein HPB52_005385 [Rhipicephalus sanguineus]|uniref:Uncharacterized protein n=1 Tax=Rhipicephalus sanguineus TaxID=34632 RepID=A0A9D4T740_RHISA|nr:hypothetical protein HPB52_005385 [Rhipicephalus sanguineus]
MKNTQLQSSRMDPVSSSTLPTGPDDQEDARPSGAAVAAFQYVNLPPFSPNSPSPCFLQVKADFTANHHQSDQVLAPGVLLTSGRSGRLSDDIASPHLSQPFHTLKAAIISRPLDTLTEMADRVAVCTRAHCLNAITPPQLATAADPTLASIENHLNALLRRLEDIQRAHCRPLLGFQFYSRSLTPPSSPALR